MKTDLAAAVRMAVLVAGSMLLQECLTAPAPAPVPRGDLRPVWRSPCGENNPAPPGHVLMPGEPAVRHPGSKTMKRVRKQLALVNQHYQDNLGNIRRLYNDMFGESQYRYDWLPHDQLKWYKQHEQCSSDKVAAVLPVLHKSLQNYSVTFEAMRKPGDSEISEKKELYALRNSLLRNISTWHKTLHCEAETAIHNMRLPVPEWATSAILSEDKWAHTPDLTSTLMRDWGVISRYRRFLRDWLIILRQLRNSPPECRGGSAANHRPTGKARGGAGAGDSAGSTQPKKHKQHRRTAKAKQNAPT